MSGISCGVRKFLTRFFLVFFSLRLPNFGFPKLGFSMDFCPKIIVLFICVCAIISQFLAHYFSVVFNV